MKEDKSIRFYFCDKCENKMLFLDDDHYFDSEKQDFVDYTTEHKALKCNECTSLFVEAEIPDGSKILVKKPANGDDIYAIRTSSK